MLEDVQKFPLHTFLHPDTFLSEKENSDYAPTERPQTLIPVSFTSASDAPCPVWWYTSHTQWGAAVSPGYTLDPQGKIHREFMTLSLRVSEMCLCNRCLLFSEKAILLTVPCRAWGSTSQQLCSDSQLAMGTLVPRGFHLIPIPLLPLSALSVYTQTCSKYTTVTAELCLKKLIPLPDSHICKV